MTDHNRPPPYSATAPPATAHTSIGFVSPPPQQQVVFPATTVEYVRHPGQTVVVAQPVVHHPVAVVHTNLCPSCRLGILTERFTCCGIFLAIIFFPLGLICCFLMKEKKCSHCGFTY